MESYYVYTLIGTIHVLGFIVYMSVLKFGFKKSVTEKMLGYYVLAWLIGLLVFSFVVAYMFDTPIDIASTLGELFGLTIAFLIFDGIAWYLGRRVYEKTRKNHS